MKYALTWEGTIRGILEVSERDGMDIAVKLDDNEWRLIQAEMIFPSKEAAEKHVFMHRLKGDT